MMEPDMTNSGEFPRLHDLRIALESGFQGGGFAPVSRGAAYLLALQPTVQELQDLKVLRAQMDEQLFTDDPESNYSNHGKTNSMAMVAEIDEAITVITTSPMPNLLGRVGPEIWNDPIYKKDPADPNQW